MASELFSLQGRRALVTGGTGHLGRPMCLALAEAGAAVYVNGRDSAKVGAFVAVLRGKSLEAHEAVFDVTDGAAVAAFFDREFASKPLHVLVNNAYAGGAGTISTSDAASYAASTEVVLGAAHNLLRSALPALRMGALAAGGASVINIASMYGVVSPDIRLYDSPAGANPPFYGAAKAALIAWTRYAAVEYGRENIRVNAISPGPFPAPNVRETNPAFAERLAQKVPMGRLGESHEIAGPVVFLASPAAAFVNGANLAADGGWTAW